MVLAAIKAHEVGIVYLSSGVSVAVPGHAKFFCLSLVKQCLFNIAQGYACTCIAKRSIPLPIAQKVFTQLDDSAIGILSAL